MGIKNNWSGGATNKGGNAKNENNKILYVCILGLGGDACVRGQFIF